MKSGKFVRDSMSARAESNSLSVIRVQPSRWQQIIPQFGPALSKFAPFLYNQTGHTAQPGIFGQDSQDFQDWGRCSGHEILLIRLILSENNSLQTQILTQGSPTHQMGTAPQAFQKSAVHSLTTGERLGTIPSGIWASGWAFRHEWLANRESMVRSAQIDCTAQPNRPYTRTNRPYGQTRQSADTALAPFRDASPPL